MATTSTTTAISTGSEVAQLRHIPLSRIVVPDAFNPRGVVADDRELDALAESLRRHGCLQPIRVRATNDGDYLLIAGERRYRAAVKAALMELPAIIRPAGGGDAEEQAQLLIEAVIENDQRVNLDALARARGYQRLIDSGLTVRGVAQRLTTTQARVREHLRILRLPEPAQAKLASGVVPLRAVKALAALTRIHPGLAQAAIAQVLDVDERDSERYTWADLERAPLEVAAAGDELPHGVYRTHVPYPLDGFELSERTRKNLAALEQLLGHPLGTVRFGPAELEQARRLGAAHGEERPLIVGADVASQLAGDYIARCVKAQRASQRHERELNTNEPSGAQDPDAGAAAERAAADARRVQRDAEREARARAVAFNAELGRGVYTSLSRVKVDERALKLLSSVNVTGELGELAMRGARYGLPGWVTESTQRNGTTKPVYIDQRTEAERRAGEYLAGGAHRGGEIVGRQIALLALAAYADQQAVAASNRSWHHVRYSGPWARDADGLLDELVAEKLTEPAAGLLAPTLQERKRDREQRAGERQAREDALARLEGIEQRIPELDADELAGVAQDVELAWAGWDPRQSELRQLLRARRNALSNQQDGD